MLQSLFDQLHAVCDVPLPNARSLPGALYQSPEFHQWERQHVFAADWLPVAHVSQIPEPGDFITIDLLGEPLVAIRDTDGTPRVFSRVCPHRSMDILPPGHMSGRLTKTAARAPLPESHGHTRFLQCPYHAWSFELNGRLVACPEMQHTCNFDRADHSLRTFATTLWNGFLFVNFDATAPPLAPDLTELNDFLAPWQPEQMVVVREQDWECDFDWKVMVENFSETYHHLGAHHSTLQPLMPAKRNWTEQERRRYLHSHLPFTDRYAAAIQSALDTGDTTATFPILPGLTEAGMTNWHIIIGYPLFLLLTAPDSWAWYRIDPIAPGKARLTTHLLVPASTRDRPDFPDLLEREYAKLVAFHLEDMEVCAAVQRGLQSRTSQPGPLSHLEMPVWLFHRYLAARTRQTWPTDDRPAALSQSPTA